MEGVVGFFAAAWHVLVLGQNPNHHLPSCRTKTQV